MVRDAGFIVQAIGNVGIEEVSFCSRRALVGISIGLHFL